MTNKEKIQKKGIPQLTLFPEQKTKEGILKDKKKKVSMEKKKTRSSKVTTKEKKLTKKASITPKKTTSRTSKKISTLVAKKSKKKPQIVAKKIKKSLKSIHRHLPARAPIELRVWVEVVHASDIVMEKDYFMQLKEKQDAIAVLQSIRASLKKPKKK